MIGQMQVYDFAKRAAAASNGTTSLNVAIAKIARDADLNRVEIQRVVEAANHAVNERLRKEAKDGTFTFEVASTDGVLQELSGAPQTKIAAQSVVDAVRGYVGQDDSRATVKSAEASNDSRRVSYLRSRQHVAKIAAWARTHQRTLLSKQAGLHAEIGKLMDDLVHFTTDYRAAGRDIVDLKKLACSHDPSSVRVWDAVFDDVLDKVAARMSAGRVDTSPSPLSRRAMPRGADLTYEVVDGSNKVLIFLDTLKHKISAEDQLAQHVRLMDTHGPAVVAGCRVLDTPVDVAKHVEQDLSKVAGRVSDLDYFLANIDKIAGIVSGLGGLAVEVGRGAAAVGKRTWRPAVTYGVPLAAAAVAGNALGHGIRKNTRDHRPGAFRGVQEGGSIE